MNFHALKWKIYVFIRSDGISEYFYATRCIFLHKFEQRLSNIAGSCVEEYTMLDNESYTMTCCRNDKVSALYLMKFH